MRTLIFCLFICLPMFAQEQSNVLLYKDPVQVSSSINAYETLVAGKPIEGSIMITHQSNAEIDPTSFSLGEDPLDVEFVETTPMSAFSNLVVSIYRFKLYNVKQGIHTLAPIEVEVAGKRYKAPPMTIQVNV